jgi:hypothetical protein
VIRIVGSKRKVPRFKNPSVSLGKNDYFSSTNGKRVNVTPPGYSQATAGAPIVLDSVEPSPRYRQPRKSSRSRIVTLDTRVIDSRNNTDRSHKQVVRRVTPERNPIGNLENPVASQ